MVVKFLAHSKADETGHCLNTLCVVMTLCIV